MVPRAAARGLAGRAAGRDGELPLSPFLDRWPQKMLPGLRWKASCAVPSPDWIFHLHRL